MSDTPTPTPTQLDGSSQTAVRGLARLARVLERSCEALTMPQYRVLTMVASGDQRASQLAWSLRLSKPTLTAAVEGLVERGFLIRSEVATDRRAVQLDLTPAGQAALASTESAMVEQLERLLVRCEDREVILASLGQLTHTLDQLAAERMAEGSR
jgi:DNA-binding MarR family transcriptional regulator